MDIIAAITDNGIIGAGGGMPWHIPADLHHFRLLTTGHTIVMGRRTWESIGRPLPDRTNIVITRQQQYEADGATVVHSLAEATRLVGNDNVFIIGGAELYEKAMDATNRIFLTRIHTTLEGDTHFPDLNWSLWTRSEAVRRPADNLNPYDLTFEIWMRNQ